MSSSYKQANKSMREKGQIFLTEEAQIKNVEGMEKIETCIRTPQ